MWHRQGINRCAPNYALYPIPTIQQYRLVLCHLMFNTSSLSRFVKSGMGLIDEFLLKLCHFVSNQSPCWRKFDYFCGCAGPKHMCVCGYRPVMYYSKVNISLLRRFMKAELGVMDNFILQPHHFLPSQSPFWRKTDNFCCCFGSKCMCAWFWTGAMPFELQC